VCGLTADQGPDAAGVRAAGEAKRNTRGHVAAVRGGHHLHTAGCPGARPCDVAPLRVARTVVAVVAL
jgi:hypothetical protein